MINPAIFIGEPLIFKKTIKIYPPKIKQVVAGPKFGVFSKILTMTQEDVNDEVKGKIPEGQTPPTPFEYLMAYCQYVEGFIDIVQEALEFFCKEKPVFSFEKNIIIINEDYIGTEEFFDFQNAIRQACGDKAISPPDPYNPNENPAIRRIKEKARERDRIKAKQGRKNGISLETCLVAICCMGIGINPLNIGEMSYASIGPIIKMMQDKEKYDIDIRSLLAGADSKKIKPKYWIRNFDEK